jgi:hypothetical protein
MTKKKTDTTPVIFSIKGFDKSFKCRDFQFEIGKTYEQEGTIKACENGFHAIEGYPLEVFSHYAPNTSRYAVVSQSGELSRDVGDSKIASAKITIGVELHVHELIQRAVKWVFDRAKPEGEGSHATGEQGAASATGEQGAASATGEQGAASATGEQGAASATGTQGAASATGTRGAASATGWQGAASATGEQGAASATGEQGKVMGSAGNALFLVHRDKELKITHAWAGIAGENGIEPGVWYRLDAAGVPQVVEE